MEAKTLIDAINATEIDAEMLEARSYSGRGMMGKNCVGVVVPRGTSLFTFSALLTIALIAESSDSIDMVERISDLADLDVKEDSMGRNTIVYFPRLAWEE